MQINKNNKIKDYRDLLVWQKSCLVIKKGLMILRKTKKDFVSLVIINQVTRSLLSVRSNIVEGWCGHYGKSFVSYLEISRGSAGESLDWFYALYDENYITKEDYDSIEKDFRELMAMLTSFINSIRNNNEKNKQ